MEKWIKLTEILKEQFGINPDVTSILYLIGIQELGRGFEDFSKDEKMDLIDMAKAKLLSDLGFYTYEGIDKDGWPEYKIAANYTELLEEKKDFSLQELILDYFEKHELI